MVLFSNAAISQADSSVFKTLSEAAAKFRPDFSNPPNDKMTRKINELRNLRGGFNINGAIAFKLGEEKNEHKISEEQWKALSAYFSKGEGASKINNAVVWIYRDHFTYKELKKLVKFYKTTAGRKMNEEFPLIMLKCVLLMETIREELNQTK